MSQHKNMYKKNYVSADLNKINMELALMFPIVSYAVNNLMPAFNSLAQALGVKVKPRWDYVDGCVCEYVSCIEHNVMYIHGYRNPKTGQVRVNCLFDWKAAQNKYYGDDFMESELAEYYLYYGAIIERGIQKAMVSMKATEADYQDYLQQDVKAMDRLRRPAGYIGGVRGMLRGLLDFYSYLLGFKSMSQKVGGKNKL